MDDAPPRRDKIICQGGDLRVQVFRSRCVGHEYAIADQVGLKATGRPVRPLPRFGRVSGRCITKDWTPTDHAVLEGGGELFQEMDGRPEGCVELAQTRRGKGHEQGLIFIGKFSVGNLGLNGLQPGSSRYRITWKCEGYASAENCPPHAAEQ